MGIVIGLLIAIGNWGFGKGMVHSVLSYALVRTG
jgi:hypothetical protein